MHGMETVKFLNAKQTKEVVTSRILKNVCTKMHQYSTLWHICVISDDGSIRIETSRD